VRHLLQTLWLYLAATGAAWGAATRGYGGGPSMWAVTSVLDGISRDMGTFPITPPIVH
jgi:hypothetical protein